MRQFVSNIRIGDREIVSPSERHVKEALLYLFERGDPDVGLSLIGEGGQKWLVIYYIQGYGFHVSGVGVNDVDHYAVVRPDLDDEIIDVWMAGSDDMEYLRCSFVPFEDALSAALHFFFFGERAAEVMWELADSVMGMK